MIILRKSFKFITNSLIHRNISNHRHNLHYDVLILGGAGMGSSSAYFLKNKSPSLKVAVIERDPQLSKASSSLSAGGIREQFSTPENIKLSQWSCNFLRNIGDFLSVDGESPSVSYTKSSYLFLATQKGVGILESNAEIQRKFGVDIKTVPADEINKYHDWINVNGIAAANICFGDKEGSFDGWSLVQAFKKKNQQLGVEYIHGECTAIDVTSKVNGITVATKDGESLDIQCDYLVNAAGPWAGELMKSIGVNLPVVPRKRYIFSFDCPKGPGRTAPLTVDPTGVYFKPDGSSGTRFICGCSPEEDEEPDVSNLDVDYDYFESFIWPVLAERYRGMEELKLCHSWAGYYDYNTLDQNSVLGCHPELHNLIFVNGFSGHGIQQCPAAGNAVSELVLDGGKFSEIDLSRLGYQRILENKPLFEVNIV